MNIYRNEFTIKSNDDKIVENITDKNTKHYSSKIQKNDLYNQIIDNSNKKTLSKSKSLNIVGKDLVYAPNKFQYIGYKWMNVKDYDKVKQSKNSKIKND